MTRGLNKTGVIGNNIRKVATSEKDELVRRTFQLPKSLAHRLALAAVQEKEKGTETRNMTEIIKEGLTEWLEKKGY